MRTMRYVSRLGLIGISLSFAACGNSLEGRWETGCVANSAGYYQKGVVTFDDGDGMVGEGSFYSDSACTNKLNTVTQTSTYELFSDVDGLEDTIQVNFIWKTITLTLNSSGQVTAYNGSSTCTYNDWALDTPKDVTGKTCTGTAAGTVTFESAGSTSYDIVKTDDDELQLGKVTTEKNRSSEDKRPTELETTFTYRLVED